MKSVVSRDQFSRNPVGPETALVGVVLVTTKTEGQIVPSLSWVRHQLMSHVMDNGSTVQTVAAFECAAKLLLNTSHPQEYEKITESYCKENHWIMQTIQLSRDIERNHAEEWHRKTKKRANQTNKLLRRKCERHSTCRRRDQAGRALFWHDKNLTKGASVHFQIRPNGRSLRPKQFHAN